MPVRNPEESAKSRMQSLRANGFTAIATALPGCGVRVEWVDESMFTSALPADTAVESVWRTVDYVRAAS